MEEYRDRACRRRRQPRPALRRTQAVAAAERLGSAVQPLRLPRDARRPLRRRVGLPLGRAARLPEGAQPGPVRGRACPGRRPVRRGGPACRAGVPRGVRQAGGPPDRADLGRRRGRQAQGLPGLGGRQPGRVLRAVPVAQRPLATTSSTPLSPRPSRRYGGSAPGTSAGEQRPPSAGGHASCRGVQSALDGMLVDRPRRKIIRPTTTKGRHESDHREGRSGPGRLRRGDRPGRPRPAPIERASHVEPDPKVAGRPTCHLSGGRCSAPSIGGARPWRPRSPGWKRTGCQPVANRADRAGRPSVIRRGGRDRMGAALRDTAGWLLRS